MKELQKKIEELVAPILIPFDAFLIDIHIGIGEKRRVIQIFIDTDIGITIDQCATISKQLSTSIDAQRIFNDSYILQVSSPGVEKSLRLLRQYHKNIGRKHKVRFQRDNKINEIIANLVAIDGEHLTFTTGKDEIINIEFSEIIAIIEQLPW